MASDWSTGSHSELHGLGFPSSPCAQVVKLVDTLASGASARKGVEVQVLFWAPHLDRLVLQAPAHTKIAAPTASFPTSTKPVPDKRTPDGLFYAVNAA